MYNLINYHYKYFYRTVCEKKDWMNFMGFLSKFCLESIKLVTEIIIDSSPEGQILSNGKVLPKL